MARFFNRNTSKIVFMPSVASLTAPTHGEINAGVVLALPGSQAVEAIADVNGWKSQNNPIPVPDLNTDFDNTIPGTNSADNPTITFYSDLVAEPVKVSQAEGTAGFMGLMWKGDVAGRKMQVWPVRVAANNEMPSLGNEAAKFEVQYAPSFKPEKNAVIPA